MSFELTQVNKKGHFEWICLTNSMILVAESTKLEIQVCNTMRGIQANLLKLYINILHHFPA